MNINNHLSFQPRWEYGDSSDEQAREIRDEAMATAALGYRLSHDKMVTLVTADGDETELSGYGLHLWSETLFNRSYAVPDQSHLSRAITHHHAGRAAILADKIPLGQKRIREAQPQIETLVTDDRQSLVNALGGAMLAEAAYGKPELAKRHRLTLIAQLPGMPPKEQLKRQANSVVSLTITSLRRFSFDEIASSTAKRALRGPILHRSIER